MVLLEANPAVHFNFFEQLPFSKPLNELPLVVV